MMEVARDYLTNSNFHGFRYLAESGRHWIERVFWLVCVCASWVFCYILVVSSWHNFQDNAISFGTDTDYINWNTSFFSVSVCEFWSKEKVYAIANETLLKANLNEKNESDGSLNLHESLMEIAFYKGDRYFLKMFCSGPEASPLCLKDGYREFSEKVRGNCSEVFHKCIWNNETVFDCCRYFNRLETERGPCFTINSIQTKSQTKIPLISNKETGPGFLRLELKEQAHVLVHSEEEVPNHNAIVSEHILARKNLFYKRVHAMTEIVNSYQVRKVDISKRKCRFPDENYIPAYPYYSYGVCLVDCRIKKQIEVCNCTTHLSPGADPDKICDLEGQVCLIDHTPSFMILVNSWSDRNGISCDCLPSCTEPEFDLTYEIETGMEELNGLAMVELRLHKLPTLRLKRTVVRDTLDLVVSMGGAAGLFVGASLLSFVELIYYFTVRCAWTAYGNRTHQLQNTRPRRQTTKKEIFTFYQPYLS